MSHKLGICIPYRNRQEHLEKLVPHLSKFLTEKGIDHKFYVGHQVDDKLFNRGVMKNIAAKYALDDGCDYIAWHDVDMLAHNDCDYSYPSENPTHIATKLSKYDYGIGYDQYFGGVVLFTKEQIERTNGYSNEYWDWGQEDDDLFWRCYYEGYTTGKILKSYKNKVVANFNGRDSFIVLPSDRNIASCLNGDHTISVLFKAEQQPDKTPIWLVGDKEKKFIEYPILRKDGSWTWGISFNNSRAVTMLIHDEANFSHYNWGKRFENLWTWVTLSYSKDEKNVYFYLNDKLTCQTDGVCQNIPYHIPNKLRGHIPNKSFLLGFCNHLKTYYKGQISEIKIQDKCIRDGVNFDDNDGLITHYDFSNGMFDNISGVEGAYYNTKFTTEDVEVIENILPHRREGSILCLPHANEGFINGGWAKGETTARNEKRLVAEMQQKRIDYKNDGMNSLKYELVDAKNILNNCLMINVKL